MDIQELHTRLARKEIKIGKPLTMRYYTVYASEELENILDSGEPGLIVASETFEPLMTTDDVVELVLEHILKGHKVEVAVHTVPVAEFNKKFPKEAIGGTGS